MVAVLLYFFQYVLLSVTLIISLFLTDKLEAPRLINLVINMNIEYEATFPNIDKTEVRRRLQAAGATLERPEYKQRRVTFNPPAELADGKKWLRVRDEGDKITMSFKKVDGDKIENQKEICLTVSSFEQAVEFLQAVGCERKAYQESKRELWQLDEVDITIDEWPYLEPLVEIEGTSEESVREACVKLGFDFSQAFFGSATTQYADKYGLSHDYINNEVLSITFAGPNPFVKSS